MQDGADHVFTPSIRKSYTYKHNIGLYRDDGLAVVETNGTAKELFPANGLKLTIEANISNTNFFHVTLDLNIKNFKPLRKENDKPQYINKHSNHPQKTERITRNDPETFV